jgi:hypothetical protein
MSILIKTVRVAGFRGLENLSTGTINTSMVIARHSGRL